MFQRIKRGIVECNDCRYYFPYTHKLNKNHALAVIRQKLNLRIMAPGSDNNPFRIDENVTSPVFDKMYLNLRLYHSAILVCAELVGMKSKDYFRMQVKKNANYKNKQMY